MALNSKTNLQIIDAICEGPIDGFAEEHKSVLLNETAVKRKQLAERKNNPPSVAYSLKKGTGGQGSFKQTYLLSDVTTTIEPVNVQVGASYSEKVSANNLVSKRDYGEGSVVRAITDTEVDFVQLVFTVPKLFCVAAEGLARGQLFFAQIKLEVAIQGRDGNYQLRDILVQGQNNNNIIKGIATSEYQFKTEPINLANNKGRKNPPYNIRVKKLTFGPEVVQGDGPKAEDAFEISFADFEDLPRNTPIANKRADTIIWNSIILGKRTNVTYPHTALVYLSVDSEEYNTLPARAYDIRGLKVKIPSNATVERTNDRRDGRLVFDGKAFDGSLKTGREWTTCPICCFYDLLTNTRYGAGDFITPDNLNWVDLIELAKYCNEIVETPEGSEARFAINTVLGSQASAYEVLQDMASVFRGMLYWKADNVQIAADHGNLGGSPLAAIHVFSNSNVVNGAFVYNGSSLKTRSTRVRVRYNDPDNFFKPDFVVIEDQALIGRYGVQEKAIVAFGCSSKYQAQRMGSWVLQSEKLHDDTVTFSVGLEGLNVLPGQIFEVSDEMRFGTRLAGRIVGARVGFVDLDQTAALPSGTNNKLSVVMKDGTVETVAIAGVSGTRVTLSSNFTQVPPDNALYAIKNDSVVLRKYRCLAVAEGEGGVYSVVGVRHVDSIYGVVEGDSAPLDLPTPYFYGGKPSPPQDLKITFQQIDDGRNTTNRGTISWSRGLTGPVSEFRVQWKVGEANNWNETFTANTFLDVNSNLQVGKRLYAQVKAVGPEPDKHQSDWSKVNREIPVGGTSDDRDGIPIVVLPPDPEEVTIEAFGVDQVILRWSPTASGQNVENFVAVVRHTSKTDGSGTWPNSTLLRKVSARTTSVVLPLLNGEYLIKFENAQKQRSNNAISAVINLPDPIPRFNYEIFREDSKPGPFSGQSSNVYYDDTYDGLILSGDGDFDSILNIDQFDSIKSLAATALVGGESYAILSAGTTDFTAIGASSNSVGTIFTATGSGSGTGTVYGYFDFIGKQVLSGEYFFYNIVDLGAKYSVRLQRILTARSLYLSDLIDDRTENIDIWSDFDGTIPDGTNVEVYFRKENEVKMQASPADPDPEILFEDGSKILFEGSTDSHLRQESDLFFDEWIPLENNAYVGRYFQFKAVLTTERDDQTPIVDELGVTFQLERRTENSEFMQSGFGTKAVTFDKAFYVDGDTGVSVGITALDLEPEDYFVVSEPTATGFTITFKGTFDGDELINRRFSYTAVGYGTREDS